MTWTLVFLVFFGGKAENLSPHGFYASEADCRRGAAKLTLLFPETYYSPHPVRWTCLEVMREP